MTVGELKYLLSRVNDDFEVNLRGYRRIPDEILKHMPYPYPIESFGLVIEEGDICYSEKDFRLNTNLDDVPELRLTPDKQHLQKA
jgi:hypothetical protein